MGSNELVEKDPIGCSQADYIAANLGEALKLVPDTGDWHGILRSWCARNRGEAKPNLSAEQQVLRLDVAMADLERCKAPCLLRLIEARVRELEDSLTTLRQAARHALDMADTTDEEDYAARCALARVLEKIR